jgi:hypothetical protein
MPNLWMSARTARMNITRLLVAAVAAAALTSVGGVALARHQTSLPSRPAGSAAVDWSAGAGHPNHGLETALDHLRANQARIAATLGG